MTLVPRPYQLVGRDFLAARRHALLADEMRVGKTPQAILAAQKVGAERILVVCPAIARPQWQREFQRWWPDAKLKQLTIASYDGARTHLSRLREMRWDVFIPDECHFAGNPAAARTKLVYGKEGVGWTSDRIWALSGTPAPKSAASLWPMLRAFGVTGMVYEDFLRRYCTLRPMSWVPTGTKIERIPELRAMLARCMLRRTRKEVAPDMPDIAFDFLEVKLNWLTDDYRVPAELNDDALVDWLAANPNFDREDRIAVAMTKAVVLAEEIGAAFENRLYKQTVVFGWHVEPLEYLQRLLKLEGVKAAVVNGKTSAAQRATIQQTFKDGGLDVVLVNIITGGTAIDLSAASHGYFLELDWVPGNNVQAANRLISLDKAEPVTLDVVTWPGSVDDRIQRVLLTRVRQLSKLY